MQSKTDDTGPNVAGCSRGLAEVPCRKCPEPIHDALCGNVPTWFHRNGVHWCAGETAPAKRVAQPELTSQMIRDGLAAFISYGSIALRDRFFDATTFRAIVQQLGDAELSAAYVRGCKRPL